jgi:hypothetical protein
LGTARVPSVWPGRDTGPLRVTDVLGINLADSWAKHQRAMEHLGLLAIETDRYLRSVQVSAVVATTEGGGIENQFEVDAQPPPRLGTIIGDIVHNLRSALDVAAWQLAIDHNEDAARKKHWRVQFPLAENPEAFKKHKALPFFSADARRALERLQPYHRSNEALGWLRELSNSDKHRVATFSFAGMPRMSAGAEVGVTGFGDLEVRFGGEEGHLGLFGVQAIAVTVEFALRNLEEQFGRR